MSASRKLLPIALALVSALFPATVAAQQRTTISGSVIADASGLALAGATVRIQELGVSAVSGPTGRFLFTSVPSGEYEVAVRYLGYAPQTRRVTGGGESSASVVFRLAATAQDLEGVVVVGQRQGQAAALNQQRTAANITNVVASDQIGRFPDANIGDAMKRIPGITVTVDQGEARFGLIRGTEPRLNSVMLNGERIPSAEAETRTVQLDLIPSDMVQLIEVNKAVTPDMDADAIGGAVNIVTRSAPHERRVSVTAGSGYNFLAEQAMGLGSAVLADRFADDRVGLVVSGSYLNHHLGSDNIEAVWNQDDAGRGYVEEFDVRKYDIQRIRRSLSGSLDLRLSEHSTLTLRSMYNHRDDWENRYRLRYILDAPDASGVVQEAEVRRQTKGGIDNDRVRNTRLEDQRTGSHSLSGEHLLPRDIRATWSATYGHAWEKRPDERYIEFSAEDVAIRPDVSNPRKPSFSAVNPTDLAPEAFGFRRIEDLEGNTEEEERSGRLDFLVPLGDARTATSLKLGVRARLKDKFRDNQFRRYEPLTDAMERLSETDVADLSDPDYLAGNYRVGPFARREFLGRLRFDDPSLFESEDRPDEYAPGNFDAEERILAGYAMMSRILAERLVVIAGIRIEQTDIDYGGFEYNADDDEVRPTRGDDKYTNLLPGLHLKFDVTPSSVLRFAWTNTLARPNYYDLVPYRVVSFEDNELEVGNPDLEPTRSANFDLMAERYFQSVGLMSAGIFFKDIRDFIFAYTLRNERDPVTGQTFSELTRPQNGSRAKLYGMEVALQRQLDFLPGLLRNVGVYANYTYTDSDIDGLNVEGREDDDLPLPGTSAHSGNFSLSYDGARLSLRGSANFNSAFLDPGEVGDSPFFDRYYDRVVNVDANGSFTVSNRTRIFVEANNLTNQPLRYYQGVRDRMMQEEFYAPRFTAGLKFDL